MLPAPLLRFGQQMMQLWPVSDDKIGLEYKIKRMLAGSLMPADRSHVYWNGTFSDSEKRRLVPDALPGALNDVLGDLRGRLGRNGSNLNAYLWFDQKYYLADDILVKSDRISMAHSLEVRPPFLDHRMVEFANRLPGALKIAGSRQKLVLQHLMKDKLPQAVLQRPKIGFDIPAHDWLRGPLRSLLVDTLHSGMSDYPEIFRADVIEGHLQQHLERRVNIGYHLWGLMILLLWMKKWNVQAPKSSSARQWVSAPPAVGAYT
jgi:asparagine synthase (glutamine-hydrolysing)